MPDRLTAEDCMNLTLSSESFDHWGTMPPAIAATGGTFRRLWPGRAHPKKGTKSLVLIVDDPDAPDPAAPKMTWVSWVLQHSRNANGLSEGIAGPASRDLAGNQRLATHRLRRTLPASRNASLLPQALRARHRSGGPAAAKTPRLEQAMQGHVLAKCELIGRYQRQR